MNSLRCCGPRVPVPDPEIGLRLGNDPGGVSDVEAPRCEKLLAGFRLRGMRPEASRDRRRTPRGLACQGRVRLVPLQNWAALSARRCRSPNPAPEEAHLPVLPAAGGSSASRG